MGEEGSSGRDSLVSRERSNKKEGWKRDFTRWERDFTRWERDFTRWMVFVEMREGFHF